MSRYLAPPPFLENGFAQWRQRRFSVKGKNVSLSRCLVVILVAVALGSCAPPPTESPTLASFKDQNLIIIVLDTLRADHLASYGYSRETAPFIDYMARRGIVFDRAMSTSSFTLQSISSLMSGRLPTRGGSTGLWAAPSMAKPVLAEYFGDAGYRTGFITNQPILVGQITTPYELYRRIPRGTPESGRQVTQRALNAATLFRGDKFLLYVHYLDPHQPYGPADEFYHRFAQERPKDPLWVMAWRAEYDKMVKEGVTPGDPRFDEMVLRYDAEIAQTDKDIDDLITGLHSRGLLENSLIVITSDHGEEFFDHRWINHIWTLYEESIHVPLIFWSNTGTKTPFRISDRVSHVDLLPTLLELFEIPYDAEDFDGDTVFKKMGDAMVYRAPEHPMIAELIFPERTIQRVVIQDEWKLYTATRWVLPEDRFASEKAAPERLEAIASGTEKGAPMWGPFEFSALYNLRSDPGELRDRKKWSWIRYARMNKLLDDYRALVKEHGLGSKTDAATDEHHTEEELDDLKALGYL